ncbi:PfkB family carbohydrate kinase [Sorangium sp. So ce1128]
MRGRLEAPAPLDRRVTEEPARVLGDYGAGDSFAGALTYHLAHGLPVEEACRRAGRHGAAVLRGIDPLETQIGPVAP